METHQEFKKRKKVLIESICGSILSGQRKITHEGMEVFLPTIIVGIHTYKKREQLAYDHATELAEILLFG